MSAELPGDVVEMDALMRRAGSAFVYPLTPGIAGAVSARLRRAGPALVAPQPFGWVGGPLGRVTLALVVTAVVIVGIALAVPQSRSALADFFGLGHVRVEIKPFLGPTPPVLSPESFARPSSVSEVDGLLDFRVRFPSRDGRLLAPDAVYVQGEASDRPVAIFVYEEEGFDLYQTRAGFFGKGGPDPSLIHEIEFGGHPALWIDQGGHIASLLDERGRVLVASQRTVGRATLLWEENGITYRLETSLSQDEAIRVAESLR